MLGLLCAVIAITRSWLTADKIPSTTPCSYSRTGFLTRDVHERGRILRQASCRAMAESQQSVGVRLHHPGDRLKPPQRTLVGQPGERTGPEGGHPLEP